MKIDPRTAPLSAIRDWFAERDGWNKPGTYPEPTGDEMIDSIDRRCVIGKWWRVQRDKVGWLVSRFDHPYPATIDGAASAMPEGWMWSRYPDRWQADYFPNWSPESRKRSDKTVTVTDTNNEIDDRYRLAALAAQAMDAKEAQ